MFITSKPVVQFKDIINFIILFFKNNKYFKSNLIFTPSGKISLIMMLNDLKIYKGSYILIPALICDSVPKILKLHGFKVLYYEIDINGSINVKNIKKISKNKDIKVFLLVNYFGLNAASNLEIAKKLKKFKFKIIHDCSHSFQPRISDRYYDGVFFSLRKVFPIPSLGAYWCKKNLKTLYPVNFSSRDFYLIVFDLILYILKYIPILNKFLLNLNVDKKKPQLKISSRHTKINYSTYLNLKYVDQIKKSLIVRRRNFNYLLKLFQGNKYQLIFNKFDKNFVPQAFTILIKNKIMFNEIRNNGFKVYRWPGHELPAIIKRNKKKYKKTIFLNDNILCIPIHESVKKKNIYKLFKIVSSYDNQ